MERRQTQILVLPCRWHGRASSGDAHACRRSTTAPAEGSLLPKAQRRPGFLGRGGALGPKTPAPTGERRPCAVCAGVTRPNLSQSRESTSRPGRSAGRLMPTPPGSGTQLPPAGTALAPGSGMPPEQVLYVSEIRPPYVTETVTDVNGNVTCFGGSLDGAKRNPGSVCPVVAQIIPGFRCASSGRRLTESHRHCERSEAIQSAEHAASWIASSLSLLAMAIRLIRSG